jgi:putative FmdB family regulatory protein
VPTYEYACTACGHRLEAVQSFSDDPLTVCPECGEALRKVYGAVGIVLKGSGFYKTDSRAAANGKSANGKSRDGSSSDSSSGSDAKSDGGSSEKSDSGTGKTSEKKTSEKKDGAGSASSSKPAAAAAS